MVIGKRRVAKSPRVGVSSSSAMTLAIERTSPELVWGLGHQRMCLRPCRELRKSLERRGAADSLSVGVSYSRTTMLAIEKMSPELVWGLGHQRMYSRPFREILKRLDKRGGTARVRGRDSV